MGRPKKLPEATGTVIYTNPAHDIQGHDDIKSLLRVAADKNLPVLLVGDTGTGKTSIVKGMADEYKKQYVRFNLTGETTVDEFVGKYTLQDSKTVWEDGILLQAMQRGEWLIVDEINVALPEILFVLHSLLDDDKCVVVAQKDGAVVKPHPDFRFFATMNPVDEYAGTKDLNKAFKSRFNMVIGMNYPAPGVESVVIAQKTGIEQELANKIVDVGISIRQAKTKEEVFYTCSTRDLLQWAGLVNDLGIDRAFEVTVLSKSESDAPKVQEIYKKIVGHYSSVKAASGLTLTIDVIKAEINKFNKKKSQLREEVRQEFADKLGMKVAGKL